MTVRRTEDGDALRAALDAVRNTGEQASGGHSWGFAVPDGDGSVEMYHGLGVTGERAEAVAEEVDADVALGHTRWATRGGITLQNAHPFAIHDEAEQTVAALAHNGTWHEAPRDVERTDSYYIARLVEVFFTDGLDLGDAVRRAGEVTGETITVLGADGRAWAYSGRFEITATERAGVVASSGHRPVPDGEVIRV